MNQQFRYAPSSENLYRAFRRQMDTALNQPFFQNINTEVSEITLFALLVYVVCGHNAYGNDTITSVYRLFLQDLLAREGNEKTAEHYQTLLNETITKFSEVSLAPNINTAVQKLSESATNVMGLGTAQIPFVYSFVNRALSYPYSADAPIAGAAPVQATTTAQSVQPTPVQPVAPVQTAPTGAPYTVPSYTPPTTPPPSVYSQPPIATPQGQPVYTQPNYAPAQPTYTAQPTATPTYTAPAYNAPNYTAPTYTASTTPQNAALSALNKISGWLLAVLIGHGLTTILSIFNIVNYFNYGNSAYAIFSLPIPILTLAFIALVLLKNKNARYVYVALLAYMLYYYFPVQGSSDLMFAMVSCVPAVATTVYLFVSKRVKAVLGPVAISTNKK